MPDLKNFNPDDFQEEVARNVELYLKRKELEEKILALEVQDYEIEKAIAGMLNPTTQQNSRHKLRSRSKERKRDAQSLRTAPSHQRPNKNRRKSKGG